MSRTTNWANGPFRILVPGITSPSDPSRNIGAAATRNMHAVAYAPMVFDKQVWTPRQNMNAAMLGAPEGTCSLEFCLTPLVVGGTSRIGDAYAFVIGGVTVTHTVISATQTCEQLLQDIVDTLTTAANTGAPSTTWANAGEEPYSVFIDPEITVNLTDCCFTISYGVPGTGGSGTSITGTYTANNAGAGDGFEMTVGGTPSAGNPITAPLDCTGVDADFVTGVISIVPTAATTLPCAQISSLRLILGSNHIELMDLTEINGLANFPALVQNDIPNVRGAIVRAIRRLPDWTAVIDQNDDSIAVWTKKGFGPDSGTVDFDLQGSVYPSANGTMPVFNTTIWRLGLTPDTTKFVEPQCLRIGPPIIT